MIQANKLYYLSFAKDNIHVLMGKDKASTTYKFYDQSRLSDIKLKIALFSVKDFEHGKRGGVVVCYELTKDSTIIAEDTSKVLHPDFVPGLVAAIFFDVFGEKGVD